MDSQLKLFELINHDNAPNPLLSSANVSLSAPVADSGGIWNTKVTVTALSGPYTGTRDVFYTRINLSGLPMPAFETGTLANAQALLDAINAEYGSWIELNDLLPFTMPDEGAMDDDTFVDITLTAKPGSYGWIGSKIYSIHKPNPVPSFDQTIPNREMDNIVYGPGEHSPLPGEGLSAFALAPRPVMEDATGTPTGGVGQVAMYNLADGMPMMTTYQKDGITRTGPLITNDGIYIHYWSDGAGKLRIVFSNNYTLVYDDEQGVPVAYPLDAVNAATFKTKWNALAPMNTVFYDDLDNPIYVVPCLAEADGAFGFNNSPFFDLTGADWTPATFNKCSYIKFEPAA